MCLRGLSLKWSTCINLFHKAILISNYVLVAKSCLTLCNCMGCRPPGSSVHGISQARILEWVAMSFSRGSSLPRGQTQVSCTAGRIFTGWARREGIYIKINKCNFNNNFYLHNMLLSNSMILLSSKQPESQWHMMINTDLAHTSV